MNYEYIKNENKKFEPGSEFCRPPPPPPPP